MFVKPPLLFVIFYIFGVAYVNYLIYQVWFEPQKIIKSIRNIYYKLPNWYPLRGFYIDMMNDEKGWIIFNRILSILIEVFLIGVLTITLIAYFTGE